MLETKINTVIFIPLWAAKAIEKAAFPLLIHGIRAKTKEPLKGGDGS